MRATADDPSTSAIPSGTDRSSPRDIPLTLRAIQAQIGGTLSGDPEAVIVGVNALEAAQPGELTFAEHQKYAIQARQSRASAIIVPPAFPLVEGRTLLRVEHPRLTFVKAMYLFQPAARPAAGIHRKAVVAADVELGEGVTIQECAVIRSRARIGCGTIIESGAHIGERVSIGEACVIGPNVVIMHDCRIGHRVILHGGVVIGADGFGYVWTEGRHVKIPQLGNVIIEDDVELGANVCVDCATFGSTIVKRGTKVDNLVQIAHNDVIGEDVLMSGQVGLAGSIQVGNRVTIGGQAGIIDHATIGDDARIGGASVVTKSVPAGQTVWGYPAREIQRAKREVAALALLPQVVKRLSRVHASAQTRSPARRRLPRRVAR